MTKIILNISLSLGIFMSVSSISGVYAQMVNQGEFSILPNTEVGVLSNFENSASGIFINDGDNYFYGNLLNNGIFDFLTTGTSRFVGNTIQTIEGSNPFYCYDIEMDNSVGFRNDSFYLSGSMVIENHAEFRSGIINNRDFEGSFLFHANADYSQASDVSHVNGEVHKIGDTNFEFPSGHGGYLRPASISAPSDVLADFSCTYTLESSDTNLTPHSVKSTVIDQINNTEYWEITRDVGTSEVLITLSWNTNTSPNFITSADPELIRVVRWDDNQGFWIDEGGVVDTANQTVTTSSVVNEFGIYTLAVLKPNVALPDDLVIYNALTPNGDGKNDFLFIDGIERYSNNSVKIFNRQGALVFSTKNYNNNTNVFRGISDNRLTVSGSNKLPAGTYYYILEYEFSGNTKLAAQRIKKAGYLYISSEN